MLLVIPLERGKDHCYPLHFSLQYLCVACNSVYMYIFFIELKTDEPAVTKLWDRHFLYMDTHNRQ